MYVGQWRGEHVRHILMGKLTTGDAVNDREDNSDKLFVPHRNSLRGPFHTSM